jgi:uncharacterized iron-regulated membrane protein
MDRSSFSRYYTGVANNGSSSWLRRPQNVWLRRAMFQIHLWSGIAIGLYVLLISISGSAIVFRNEIYKVADQGPRKVQVRGEKLPEDALKKAAEKLYPGDSVGYVWPSKEADVATEIWLDHNGKRNQRLFDPYTAQDLGPSVPYAIQVTAWFMELHTDLLGDQTGREINGWMSVIFTVLCITGLIVWWPGIDRWRRSLIIDPRSGWKRINWDLHSAVGFWSFGLVFMWAVTGIFVVWPVPIERELHKYMPLIRYAPPEDIPEAVNSLPAGIFAQPVPLPPVPQVEGGAGISKGEFGKGKGRRRRPEPVYSKGDQIIRWAYYLHFGNFAGNKVKALWVLLGLLPAMLFITGTIMWWNRVLSPSARRSRKRAAEAAAASGS